MLDTFSKRENETTEQWQVRILLEKIVGGIDLDWPELSSLEAFKCSGDYLKKICKGVELVYKAERISTTENFALEKVKLEKQQMLDLRREVNEIYRAQARDELLKDSVVLAASMMPPIKINRHPKKLSRKASKERILFVAISDTHYGKEVKILGVNGKVLNEYSPEIFERRMEEAYNKISDLIETGEYSSLYISHLGDSIDGMLRVNQLMSIRYGIVDSSMRFGEYMANWLHKLSQIDETFPIKYFSVLGNHSEIRPLGSKHGEFKGENIDKMVVWWMKERLKNSKNVTIYEPSALCSTEIFKCNALMIHGEHDKKPGEAPKEYSNLYQTPFTYVFRGHLHSLSVKNVGITENGNAVYEIQTPSICGIDDLCLDIKKFSSAGCAAITFEEKDGLTDIKPIYLR